MKWDIYKGRGWQVDGFCERVGTGRFVIKRTTPSIHLSVITLLSNFQNINWKSIHKLYEIPIFLLHLLIEWNGLERGGNRVKLSELDPTKLNTKYKVIPQEFILIKANIS